MSGADRIVEAVASREDEAVDRAIRPKKLADYVGQEQVKAQLADWLSPRGLAFNEDKTRVVNLALLTELTAEFRQVVGGVSEKVASLPA